MNHIDRKVLLTCIMGTFSYFCKALLNIKVENVLNLSMIKNCAVTRATNLYGLHKNRYCSRARFDQNIGNQCRFREYFNVKINHFRIES